VAQLEKSLGKARFAPIAATLVTQPPGKPALVPDSDPRPAINAAEEARAQFGVGDKEDAE
jgi:hypothetical protein